MSQTNALQNCPQWYGDRLFHFTASELHKLLTPGRGGGLSRAAESYIFDKLAEELTAGTCLDYAEVDTRAIRWGHNYEADARTRYEERTGQRVELCGFVEWSPLFGGSPDGLVGDDGGIEIKCPYSSAVHARYLLLSTPADLERLRPEYYAQMQGNMLATGRAWMDFVSFDPRVQCEALALKILRIPRDEPFIDRILKCLEEAASIKEQIMQQLAELCF